MSEIPMPTSDPYQPRKESSGGCGSCAKIGVVICVLFIIGIVVIAMVFWGGFLSIFGGIGGGGSSYDQKSLASSNNYVVDIFPAHYYNEFVVYSYEVQTTTSPDVHFDISVVDTGSDAVTITVHFAIYEIDLTTFEDLSWLDLNSYLIEEGDYTTSQTSFFNINNYASTYVWVFWFDATSKTDVWTVDYDLTLRYNWNL